MEYFVNVYDYGKGENLILRTQIDEENAKKYAEEQKEFYVHTITYNGKTTGIKNLIGIKNKLYDNLQNGQ